MYLKKPILAALILTGTTMLANAQHTSKDSVNNLNEVVVNENRLKLPFSSQNRNIWIIDKEKIKSLPVRSVAELLSFVSGVDVRQRGPAGTQADIGMDGGTFDETLVLLRKGVRPADGSQHDEPTHQYGRHRSY
jgi:vitamin B12 transporter